MTVTCFASAPGVPFLARHGIVSAANLRLPRAHRSLANDSDHRKALAMSATTPSTAASSSSSSSSPSPSHAKKPDPNSHSSLQQSGKGSALDHYQLDTRVIHGGMHQDEWTTDPLGRSVVNPPVYRASTITFPNMATLRYAAADYPFTGIWYGRHGNPTTFALEEAFSVLEGADNSCLTGSGVAAVNASILAFVKSGDHVLITDACYDPTRSFCDNFLARFGVTTTYYSPLIDPEDFANLIQDNSKVVVVESPSSLSFEVMDIDAIAEKAHARGLKVIVDNTWGPTIFRPFEHGCDVSVNAATKYLGGHSDLMMGITSARDQDTYRAIKKSVAQLGCPPGSDDAYLTLRGIRTLRVRLKQHGETGLALARWLETRPEVKRVMHPGLESHPQHTLFKRQFTGVSGLFGLQLVEGFSRRAVDAMLDGMKLFALGFSWGGYESLIMYTNINSVRTVEKWKYGDGYGPTLRIHAGLEDINDLIADLEGGFDRLSAFSE